MYINALSSICCICKRNRDGAVRRITGACHSWGAVVGEYWRIHTHTWCCGINGAVAGNIGAVSCHIANTCFDAIRPFCQGSRYFHREVAIGIHSGGERLCIALIVHNREVNNGAFNGITCATECRGDVIT